MSTNMTKYGLRPTPVINQDLMNNTRVIHNIISVPNKVQMKRNQIYNTDYIENLKAMEKKAEETSIALDLMIQLPLETESSTTNTDAKAVCNTLNANVNETNKIDEAQTKDEITN